MYGLPPDLDLTKFVGLELLQLCLGCTQVMVNFDRDVSINMNFSSFTYDGERHGMNEGCCLVALLGRSVTSAERRGRGDLVLRFGEHQLIIHDDDEHYESYTISMGSDVIVV